LSEWQVFTAEGFPNRLRVSFFNVKREAIEVVLDFVCPVGIATGLDNLKPSVAHLHMAPSSINPV
jgi:hypothetical protein